MADLFHICDELLWIYRERMGSPAFWAEPINALTNASFLVAAAFAICLAIDRRALTPITIAVISLVAVIGCGSFFFHTIPNRFTMWFDIIPIALFQVLFLWLVSCEILSLSRWASAGIVICVVGSSFALMPVDQLLNGSLFYIPSLVAMLTFGALWARRSVVEPYLLLGAACCFTLAITARSVDWIVPWRFGTHFLWHVLNGVVVYLALRAWIVFVAENQKMEILTKPLSELRDRIDRELNLPK